VGSGQWAVGSGSGSVTRASGNVEAAAWKVILVSVAASDGVIEVNMTVGR
jgi:hypothetical protein